MTRQFTDGVPYTLWLLIAMCLVAMFRLVMRPARLYEFPYFMSVTFLAFICPQAYAVTLREWDSVAVGRMTLMALLCYVSCWVGYYVTPGRSFTGIFAKSFIGARFFAGAILCLGVGS